MWGQYLLSVSLGEEGWWFNCFIALKHVEKWSSTFISFSSGRVPNRFHIWVNYGQSRPHVIVTYIDFKLRLVFLPLHWLKYSSLYSVTMHEKFLFYNFVGRWYQFSIWRYILYLFWKHSFSWEVQDVSTIRSSNYEMNLKAKNNELLLHIRFGWQL